MGVRLFLQLVFGFLICPLLSVVCNQLGFGDAVRVYSNGYYGRGGPSMPIWLDEVQCTTGERYLSECSHNGWGNNSCTHSEDAGVVCTGPPGLLLTRFLSHVYFYNLL